MVCMIANSHSASERSATGVSSCGACLSVCATVSQPFHSTNQPMNPINECSISLSSSISSSIDHEAMARWIGAGEGEAPEASLCLLTCFVALSPSLSWLVGCSCLASKIISRCCDWSIRIATSTTRSSSTRWKTILLMAMLESSSRLAPSNQAMPMVCCLHLEAWCSTIVEVSCSSWTPTITECKYSRAMMMAARSCPSSARRATNQASSSIHGALRSITIMIASSSPTSATVEYNHGL